MIKALIMAPDRYFGNSSPYADLTADHLQYLTLRNAIADLVYFAETVKLPFDASGKSSPSKAVSIHRQRVSVF